MMILLWILCIASIIGSAIWLLADRYVAKWSQAVSPWAEVSHFEGGFGRRS